MSSLMGPVISPFPPFVSLADTGLSRKFEESSPIGHVSHARSRDNKISPNFESILASSYYRPTLKSSLPTRDRR